MDSKLELTFVILPLCVPRFCFFIVSFDVGSQGHLVHGAAHDCSAGHLENLDCNVFSFSLRGFSYVYKDIMQPLIFILSSVHSFTI